MTKRPDCKTPTRDVRALDKFLLKAAEEARRLQHEIKTLMAADLTQAAAAQGMVSQLMEARKLTAALGNSLFGAQTEAFRMGGRQ
jgi:hypothetical protein